MWLGDLEAVARIERASFGASGWGRRAINQYRSSREVKSQVIVDIRDEEPADGLVVGHFIWERGKNGVRLHRLAVDPEFRRRGIGGMVVDHLLRTCFAGGVLTTDVDERNVYAQKWLRKMQFTCSTQLSFVDQDDLYQFDRVVTTEDVL